MMMKPKTRWFIQSVIGLLLTGAGLTVAIDAGVEKFSGGEWFWQGTLGLILFNAGLSLVIDGTKYRVKG
ncbi:hypothetical protein AO498_14960 [Algoriphagus sanaruensis]|uniref:Uncharacterized protein n=2 Tax=Algoriphagus sanaruensis TaxID=1727163 RepID=A0A142ERJ7_9BACT|nr:hypothetical protein AO498_14960 [Algoriphagus sanaruensis]